MKRLLIVSALLVAGCNLGEGRNVRAYNTCLARHPQGAVVFEGPRQAHEIDPSNVKGRLAGDGRAASPGLDGGSAVSGPPPDSSDPNARPAGSPKIGAELREERQPFWTSVLFGFARLTLGPPGAARAKCGKQCDTSLSSDIDDCRLQYDGDPADADDLMRCIQEARDDYRSCLDDCANAALLATRRWRLALRTSVPDQSLCRSSLTQLRCHWLAS